MFGILGFVVVFVRVIVVQTEDVLVPLGQSVQQSRKVCKLLQQH